LINQTPADVRPAIDVLLVLHKERRTDRPDAEQLRELGPEALLPGGQLVRSRAVEQHGWLHTVDELREIVLK